MMNEENLIELNEENNIEENDQNGGEEQELVEIECVPRRRKGKLRYRVGIIGGGSWATAIAKILSENLKHINWWVREPEIEEGISKYGNNPLYLSSVHFNHGDVNMNRNLKYVISKSDYIVIVTPSAFLYETFSTLPKTVFKKKKIISAVKGIIPETNQLITDYFREYFEVPLSNMSLISGPSHAEEIAQERLTFLTAASANPELAELVAKFFKTRYVRTTTSNDMMGIELSVTLKNIYALGAGIYSGLGFGDNFLAAYIANCVKEVDGFVNHLYPNTNRYSSISVYLGDLLVTCYSSHSRNRLFGKMIGQGFSVRTAQIEMQMIAEGYYATHCIYRLCKQVDYPLPIVETLHGILYDRNSVSIEMNRMTEHFI